MKKLVINSEYCGCIDLSLLAKKEYAKLEGFNFFFYKGDHGEPFIKCDEKEYIFLTKKDYGDKIDSDNTEFIYSLYNDRNIPRDNKNLIKVIEKFKEKANGTMADLRIIEVPNDLDWDIIKTHHGDCDVLIFGNM